MLSEGIAKASLKLIFGNARRSFSRRENVSMATKGNYLAQMGLTYREHRVMLRDLKTNCLSVWPAIV